MSSSSSYDVVVAGLGAMGSAAAYHLSKYGARVAGFDRFHPPHDLGSSHGRTRIIREAYFEHPLYVPLIQRAYTLWGELEKASGRKLFTQTGGLMIGAPEGVLVNGAKASAELHGLPYKLLSTSELRQRFQVFEPEVGMVGLLEPRAGILYPEEAVRTHLELAARAGVELHYHEPIIRWEADGAGVHVHTHSRSLHANRLLLATGSWMSSCLPGLNLPLKVERQVLCWFETQADHLAPDRCPIFICEYEPSRFFYGFPDLGDGLKVAIHHQGETVDPETVNRDVNEQDVKKVIRLFDRFRSPFLLNLKSSTVCLYTNTPDEHFILDQHPQHPQVVIASPCSGHGFKFSSVIGELAAALVGGQKPAFDLSLFRSNRF